MSNSHEGKTALIKKGPKQPKYKYSSFSIKRSGMKTDCSPRKLNQAFYNSQSEAWAVKGVCENVRGLLCRQHHGRTGSYASRSGGILCEIMCYNHRTRAIG